jgi:hypothetical protein
MTDAECKGLIQAAAQKCHSRRCAPRTTFNVVRALAMSYPAPTAVGTYSGSRRTERRRSPDVAKQSQSSIRLAPIWRHVRLRASAAFGAAVVGIIFGYLVVRRGYLVAGNDLAMQISFP